MGGETAPWWKTAVFYQIYPRSFRDTNGDGVGDLPGIIEKLDYIADLGISALWVSPFFRSPMDDFGYDISDYRDVDPSFGCFADARTLIAECHKRGLKIVFDLVINHTSDQHPWFIDARRSKDNPRHDWYIWKPRTSPRTGKRLRKPNNWVCQFEFKSAWWDNEETDEWYLATFTRHQPEVNWRNPELRAAMYDVVRFWLTEGVDGFRMDVVNWYVKDAYFRSNPLSLNANPDIFQRHVYDRNQPETHEICREIRAIAEDYPGDRVLIGEIFSREPSIAASYQGNGDDELHLAFNMELLYRKWNAKKLAASIKKWYGVLPERGWPNFTLSNHDQPRHATRFQSKNPATQKKRTQIAAMLLLTLKGTPFLYYGEELGLQNAKIPRAELVDPTGITFWPLPMGRDGERTPMPWNADPGAGFTDAKTKPWLRFSADVENTNVRREQNDETSLWRWYQALLGIRRSHQSLQTGTIEFSFEGQRGVIAYRRQSAPEGEAECPKAIDCYLNLSNKSRAVPSPKGTVLLSNSRETGMKLESKTLVLAPHEALLVIF